MEFTVQKAIDECSSADACVAPSATPPCYMVLFFAGRSTLIPSPWSLIPHRGDNIFINSVAQPINGCIRLVDHPGGGLRAWLVAQRCSWRAPGRDHLTWDPDRGWTGLCTANREGTGTERDHLGLFSPSLLLWASRMEQDTANLSQFAVPMERFAGPYPSKVHESIPHAPSHLSS